MVEHILNLEKRLMNYDYKEFDELLSDGFLVREFRNSYDKKALLEAVKGRNTGNSKHFSLAENQIT